jgi:hypothetical protein
VASNNRRLTIPLLPLDGAKIKDQLMQTPKFSQRRRNHIHAIALDFHKRVCREEMARVNFLTAGERKKYLNRLRRRIGRLAANKP